MDILGSQYRHCKERDNVAGKKSTKAFPNFHDLVPASLFPPPGAATSEGTSPRGADGVEVLPRAYCTRFLGCGRRGPTGRASGLAGCLTDWRRTPRHVSPLRRSHTPRRGAAQAAGGSHHRRWMVSMGRYYGGLAFPTPCTYFGDRTPRRGAAQAIIGVFLRSVRSLRQLRII